MTDHITIHRALLERCYTKLMEDADPAECLELVESIRAELAKPADIAVEMSAVADQFAHKLALDLECVLADYSGTWYDTAIRTLGAYREAMNTIHERESPTFMGEPVFRAELAKPVEQAKPVAWMDDFGNVFPIGANKGAGSWMDAHQRSWKPLYLHQPTPTWHDVSLPTPDGSAEANKVPHPTGGYEYDEIDAWSEPLVRAYARACVEASLEALKAERDAAMKDAERYRWLTRTSDTNQLMVCDTDTQRLYFGWEADEVIDAAIAKAEGGA